MWSTIALYFLAVSLAGCTASDDAESAYGGPISQPPASYLPADEAAVEAPEALQGNPFVLAGSDPFSTFAAGVDTASHDIFRSSLLQGAL